METFLFSNFIFRTNTGAYMRLLDVTSHLRRAMIFTHGRVYSSQFLLNVDFNADEQMIFSSVKIRGQKYPADVYTILGSQDSLQDTKQPQLRS